MDVDELWRCLPIDREASDQGLDGFSPVVGEGDASGLLVRYRGRMDTELLRVFVRVVESGSLSAAARSMQIDLSTTSRRVGALEDAVGATLLVRTARGIRPTPAGQRLAGRAREVLRDLREAMSEASAEPAGGAVPIALTSPPEVATSLLPSILPAVAASHPEVTFDVSASPRRVGLTEEGFDAAFRIGDHGCERLILRDLGVMRLVTCTRPGATASAHIRVRSVPDSLAAGLAGPARATVSTFGEAAALVARSDWETTVPLYCIRSQLARGELTVRQELTVPVVHLYLALEPGRRGHPVLKTLAEVARDVLADSQAWPSGPEAETA